MLSADGRSAWLNTKRATTRRSDAPHAQPGGRRDREGSADRRADRRIDGRGGCPGIATSSRSQRMHSAHGRFTTAIAAAHENGVTSVQDAAVDTGRIRGL